jgi:hypothetical protein
MAINFPDPPLTTGQTFTASQRTWTWNGRAWQASSTTAGYTGSAGTNGALGYTGSIGYSGSIGPAGSTFSVLLKSSAYTLQSSDDGYLIITTGGGITVPAAIFSVGQNVTIFNNSASSQTITQSFGVTMYWVSSTTGNRTLAAYGLVTIVCVGTNTFVISGGVLT